MEMSGVPRPFRDMLAHMNHGGKVALLGIPPADMAIDWNQVIFKGWRSRASTAARCSRPGTRWSRCLQSGLDLSPLITHHYAAEEFESAFATAISGASGKVRAGLGRQWIGRPPMPHNFRWPPRVRTARLVLRPRRPRAR
jgi:threonine 3-dehydrogenase